MRPYDALSTFDALPGNEMPPLDPDDERAEIDRLLGIIIDRLLGIIYDEIDADETDDTPRPYISGQQVEILWHFFDKNKKTHVTEWIPGTFHTYLSAIDRPYRCLVTADDRGWKADAAPECVRLPA